MNKLIPSILLILLATPAFAEESRCFGTTSHGRLENGVKLPNSGKNYRAYSSLASLLQRTYVHSTVRDIVLSSYAKLEKEKPNTKYVYGETGWPSGGRFRPHKTHQNGLSADFMVPLIGKSGDPAEIKTNALNKYGYNVDFDTEGRDGDTTIDFEALAEHIYALHLASNEYGADIARVFYAPDLQRYLFKTKRGEYLKKNIKFNNKQSWVRHDDHYHVDFHISCTKLDG